VPHAELTAPSQPLTIAALSQMIAVPEYPVSALSDGLAKYYFRILRIGENPWALRQVDTPFFRAVPARSLRSFVLEKIAAGHDPQNPSPFFHMSVFINTPHSHIYCYIYFYGILILFCYRHCHVDGDGMFFHYIYYVCCYDCTFVFMFVSFLFVCIFVMFIVSFRLWLLLRQWHDYVYVVCLSKCFYYFLGRLLVWL
jgi:hypothetical protein